MEQGAKVLKRAGFGEPSVYETLAEQVIKFAERRPADAFSRFEEHISQLRKRPEVPPNILDRFIKISIEREKTLLKAQPPNEEQPPTEIQIQDASELMHELRKFGVGLGEEETLQIQQHIQTHFSTLNLKQVRLFAKIIGLEKDYYVVQGEPVAEFVEEEGDAEEEGKTGAEGEEEKTGEEQEEEAKEEEEGGEEAPGEPQIDADPDEPPTPQPRKLTLKEEIPKEEREDKTPNQYIYWVSNGPTDTWKRLPDITPKQIVAARQQSYTLTGNLNAKVNEGYPVFPGREKHYLRAQLARILHQTSLIPKPPPKKKEGEEEEEGNEEEGEITEKPVDIGPLVEGEGWILERPPILVQGRVKKYPPIGEGEEEGTGAEEEEDEEKIDPKKKERKLKLLEAKKEQERGEVWERIDEEGIELEGINGKHPTFSIRTDEIQGDKVVLVKNNIWPGSFTVAYGGRRGRIGKCAS